MKAKLNKDKINKTIQAILVVLIIFTIGFIWSNSLKPIPESIKQSEAAKETIENITSKNDDAEKNPFVDKLVKNIRKTAHITEFMVLGLELSFLIILMNKKNKMQQVWNMFSIGIIIAVIDEALQIISRRGPVVKDILIDSLGLLIGALIIGVIFAALLLINKILKLKNKNF